jgi:hypothetical protein
MSNKKPTTAKKSGPVVEAIGFTKTSAGYVVVDYKIQDGQVVSESYGEPDIKAIAIEDAKIKFVRKFMDRDFDAGE